MPTIKLNAAKESSVLQGHPWIFPKAIVSDTSHLKSGDLVRIVNSRNEAVGMGVFNEHSLYRVRVLSYSFESIGHADLSEIIPYRLHSALLLRKALHLPNAQTNAYRLFNSEGDGLSGLTIDIYDTLAVVSSSAFWVEQYRALIEENILALKIVKEIAWLSQVKPLKQDGWEHDQKPQEFTSKIEILENGIRYLIDFRRSQKTGMFLDQRENHFLISTLSQNKRVLDLYCFTGGFAFSAAKAGAKSVLAIDSSEHAIAQARENALLNGFSNITFQEADAREQLALAKDCDLIILDPPKVVPSRKHLRQGEKYYQHLHQELFRVMQKGALLLTCNCSAAMTKENFINLIRYCAHKTQRQIRILGAYGAAVDHPILSHFPEGNYLHSILLAVE